MNELFLRKATLDVGPAPGQGPVVLLPFRFDGFRITFEIEKTPDATPNPAKISVYNLAPASRSKLENSGLAVILQAGYSGIGQGDPVVSQIFAGDVRRTVVTRQGPDVVTTIEAGDAEVLLRTTTMDAAVGPMTPIASLIAQVAAKFGLPIGTMVPAPANLVIQNGASLSGLASDHLDTLTKMASLEWHVTDGEINILDPSNPILEPPVLVSVETGLIGYPSKTVEQILSFTSLLNPAIKPGRAVQLVSDTVTGTFQAKTCRYRGDTHGGDWTVTVEAY